MRSVLYRFPELDAFERVVAGSASEVEFALPSGETAEDGEWLLAIFELGPARRATAAAGRASASPEGIRVVFEPRDLRQMTEFAAAEALRPAPVTARPADVAPETARSAGVGDAGVISAGVSSAGATAGASPRILIVDDDPDIREVVAVMLRAVGLEVVAVDTGERALERVAAEPFDLLVLDWNLPRMTGIELCRVLRKDPSWARMPVLFLTANASSQDMVEAFASGGDDYVVKPFRAPELGARIFSLLRRAHRPG